MKRSSFAFVGSRRLGELDPDLRNWWYEEVRDFPVKKPDNPQPSIKGGQLEELVAKGAPKLIALIASARDRILAAVRQS